IVSMLGQMIVEFALGYAIGILPTIVIVGIQTGAQLATGTMGLGASQLIDPTTGGSLSSLSRLQGDMVTAIFLLGGGHYILIPALLGLSGPFLPGTFQFTGLTTELLVNRFGDIFRVAALASAPVIIALLLTQFVMGLITKAVPTVNIFIVSFPLTVGIGFVLTMAAIPEMARFAYKELSGLEKASLIIIDDQQMADSSTNPTP
ncbi:MAG: flagellar biosynthetic protein FliR, partial [Bdellovibrionales bacterium]|nr:flagellar biosynthetic protein FliR [Bdellovibrionales bacterium]